MARFSSLEKLLGTLVGLDLARPGTTRRIATEAVRAITRSAPPARTVGARALAALPSVVRPVAGLAGRAAAANPVTAGALLGGAVLQSDPGQELLELAAERGAADRIRLEQAIDERIFAARQMAADPMVQRGVRSAVKRKATKYSKAVKAGMAAVKKSKFIGSPGRINNSKKAFGTVNKVVSKVNKGLKPAKKGVSGVISRAVKGILR